MTFVVFAAAGLYALVAVVATLAYFMGDENAISAVIGAGIAAVLATGVGFLLHKIDQAGP